jgi:hypothetical protein
MSVARARQLPREVLFAMHAIYDTISAGMCVA